MTWPLRFISGELFLRGPVPLAWLATAGHLGGRALHVGFCIAGFWPA